MLLNYHLMDWRKIMSPSREDDVLIPYRFKDILPSLYHDDIVMANYVRRLASVYGLEHEVDGHWDYLEDLLHGFYEEYSDYSVCHYIFPIMYEHVAIKKDNNVFSVMFLGPQFDLVTTLVPNVYILDAFVRRLELHLAPYNFDFHQRFYLLFYGIEHVKDVYDSELKLELLNLHSRLKTKEFSDSVHASCMIKRFFDNTFIKYLFQSAILSRISNKFLGKIRSLEFKKR